jgi:dsDNA-binding SOS-regulon protein
MKFIIHRTARRKTDDILINAKNEEDAWNQMISMANEGFFGVWKYNTDPWVETLECKNGIEITKGKPS